MKIKAQNSIKSIIASKWKNMIEDWVKLTNRLSSDVRTPYGTE
jgi:hypothetical protein